MTVTEFSNEFDVLYNNIMSNQAPGLDEYEKSVFLTRAQEDILKAYFDPRGNKYQEGFDDNARRQIEFSDLIKVIAAKKLLASDAVPVGFIQTDPRSVVYKLPTNPSVFIILNERVLTNDSYPLTVVPITYTDYTRLMQKPFKGPLKNQVWRLFQNGGRNLCELIMYNGDEIINSYIIRYIIKPNPIILTQLPSNLSIEGESEISECRLPEVLHKDVLLRAVELAKAAITGDLSSTIALGQNSGTEKGVVSQSK